MDYWNEYRWSQRKIINKDASKDIRTSEFEVSKASGKVNGTISVYINEPVNGKPFKYDHHYNIIFKFDGKDSGATGSPNIITILLLNLMGKIRELLAHQISCKISM